MRDLIVLVSSCSTTSCSSSSSSSISTPPNPSSSSHNRHFRSSNSAKLPLPPPWSSSSAAAAVNSKPLSPVVRLDSGRSTSSQLRYFADFAAKLARAGKFDDFAMIVDSLAASGVDASRFAAALGSDFAEKGISGLLGGGRVRAVVSMLRKLDEFGFSPVEVFDGAALEALKRECRRVLKCEQVEEFFELVEALSGYGFPVKELAKPYDVIRVCVNSKKPKLAVRYACTLPNSHMVFCDIINDFGKKGDLMSALTAYEASKKNSSRTNMYLYRTMIDVCGRCHNYLKSRYVYEDLLTDKITPNVYVFNSLMNVNASDLNYTLNVHRDMENLGVQPDMASYNVLLKSCCLAGRVDVAQDIYKEVRNLESEGVLKLDVFTYSTIVKVLADAKLWQMALKVKKDMVSSGVTPNTVTWSSLISACANAGMVEKALQLFEEMLLAGCEPNSQCCNILLHACVEACQYDRAFRLFDLWKRKRLQEASGKGDGENQYGNGDERETSLSQSPNLYGLEFAKDIRFIPTATTYNILMKACGSNYCHAKGLMEEMKSEGLSPNQITWSILIDICGSSRNVEGVLQILKTMRANGIEPDVVAYTNAIKVCVENKELKLAFDLFAQMRTYQIQPNLVTYNTLLRARSRYGSLQEVKQCLAVYQDMRRAGYNANDFYLKQLIEEWCEGVIQGNNQKEEPNLYDTTESDRPQSFLLEKVAEHLEEKHTAERLAIDLQGLTKVEARILVLAVLRMIKENYHMGRSVNDDMLIILGAANESAPSEPELLVKEAITKLLQNELGLEVQQRGLKIAPSRDQFGLENLRINEPFQKTKYPTRRPMVVMQRLKVTRESLQQWLNRKGPLKGN